MELVAVRHCVRPEVKLTGDRPGRPSLDQAHSRPPLAGPQRAQLSTEGGNVI
jgi:hypothetical protein